MSLSSVDVRNILDVLCRFHGRIQRETPSDPRGPSSCEVNPSFEHVKFQTWVGIDTKRTKCKVLCLGACRALGAPPAAPSFHGSSGTLRPDSCSGSIDRVFATGLYALRRRFGSDRINIQPPPPDSSSYNPTQSVSSSLNWLRSISLVQTSTRV